MKATGLLILPVCTLFLSFQVSAQTDEAPNFTHEVLNNPPFPLPCYEVRGENAEGEECECSVYNLPFDFPPPDQDSNAFAHWEPRLIEGEWMCVSQNP